MNLKHVTVGLLVLSVVVATGFVSFTLGHSSALQEVSALGRSTVGDEGSLGQRPRPSSDPITPSTPSESTILQPNNSNSDSSEAGIENLSESDDGSPISVVETEFLAFPLDPETSLVARIASLGYDEALLAAQSEAIDTVWAEKKRVQVSEAVTGLLDGSSASPTNLECRSTTCLVEFYGGSELTEQPELLIDFMRMANDVGGKAAVNVDENDLRRGLLVIEWPSD